MQTDSYHLFVVGKIEGSFEPTSELITAFKANYGFQTII